MRVIIVQRIFSHYRKALFDLLAKDVDLLVLHSYERNEILQIITPYSMKIPSFKYGKKETSVYLFVIRAILKFRPQIIVHEFTPSIISLHTSFLISRVLGIKFVLWGHGYNRNRGFNPTNSFVSKIRLFYMRHSDAIILYGYETKTELSKYIAEKKIFVAPNTLDTRKLLEIYKSLNKIGRLNVKKLIHFKHQFNIIFIGRLLKTKMPDVLINVYEIIAPLLNDKLAVHFIGEGEMLDYLKHQVKLKELSNNIFFHGAIHDEIKIGELLFASDLMVMPGYVGLSVNHAFCFGCPVATYKQGPKGPFHSPEIEYLIDNVTGILAKSYDIVNLSERILAYLLDEKQQVTMRSSVTFTINNVCSINNMLEGFTKCFETVSRSISVDRV